MSRENHYETDTKICVSVINKLRGFLYYVFYFYIFCEFFGLLRSTSWGFENNDFLISECKTLGTKKAKIDRYDLNIYRIYSRISREILDKIWQIFLQFDLYAGQKFGSGKHDFIHYLCVLRHSKPLKRKIKKWNFGHFFRLIFPIRLIRGSTYTRVYTVLCLKNW